MKTIVFFLLLSLQVLMFSNANSQDYLWQKKFIHDENETLAPPHIIDIDEGLLIVCDIRTSNGNAGNKLKLIRINKDGDTLWSKRIILSRLISTGTDGLQKINNENIILYGRIENNNIFYIQINNSGDLISEKYMNQVLSGVGNIWTYLYTTDSSFIASYSDEKNKQCLFVKYNMNFDIIDSIRFNYEIEDTAFKNPYCFPRINSKTNDGGYLMSYYQSFTINNIYLFKTDKDFHLQWSKVYNSHLTNNQFETFITRYFYQNNDNSLVVVLNNSTEVSDSTMAIMCLDSSGNLISTKLFGEKIFYDIDKPQPRTSCMKVVNSIKTNDSGYILGCDYRYPSIVKLDSKGTIEWIKKYNVLDTNLSYGLTNVIQNSDGSYYISVSECTLTDSLKGLWTPQNAIILKISDNASEVIEGKIDKITFNISPNPTNDKLVISNLPYSLVRVDIEIYDILGEIVYNNCELNINNYKNNFSLDVTSLPNGIYYFKIKINNNIYSNKFLKY